MPVIKTNNLSIGYRTRTVATGITAAINPGEMTCLLGENGVGKSTLLRTLAGFQRQLAGEIVLQDKRMEDYAPQQLAHVIAVVLTDRIDIRNITAGEIVALGRTPYTGFRGRMSDDDRRITAQSLEQTGVAHLAQRPFDTLSDGERQKVMIAKAIAQQTPVIILDEPTAFLDYPSRIEILQLLHYLCAEAGKAIFLSSHDLELALQLADNLWVMYKPGTVTIGTPEELATDGTLTRVFTRRTTGFNTELLNENISHALQQRKKNYC